MKKVCKTNLEEIKSLLISISNLEYSEKLKILNNVSIGEHVRHILEFYQTIIFTKHETISYEKRERNLLIQNDKVAALEYIEDLLSHLENISCDKKIIVQSDFGILESSTNRELFYALEHSIHHQAIIKIGLSEIEKTDLVDKNFGVAPSTIAYQKKLEKECAH